MRSRCTLFLTGRRNSFQLQPAAVCHYKRLINTVYASWPAMNRRQYELINLSEKLAALSERKRDSSQDSTGFVNMISCLRRYCSDLEYMTVILIRHPSVLTQSSLLPPPFTGLPRPAFGCFTLLFGTQRERGWSPPWRRESSHPPAGSLPLCWPPLGQRED